MNYLVKYFFLNRRERNAFIAVVSLLFVLVGIKIFILYLYTPKADAVWVADIEKTAQILIENQPNKEGKNRLPLSAKKDSVFFFNPNNITKEQAQQLGFTEKQAQTFINYRNKGAVFYDAQSLKKLYFMNEVLYAKLAPYVLIDAKKISYKKETKKEIQQVKIEINTADSTEWMQLRGIKQGRARLIIKYRNALGGFYTIEQLKEVYSFNDSLYNSIKEYLTCDTSKITKLPVNSIEFKAMLKHPYIKYEGTKCIFALKRNKKIIAKDVINSSCFSREHLEKVLRYLNFE
ncbi:MAG: helix-hairpin-helix domain-containing protein [Bacteroidetes bacterium]|nr:helix-hairpin-helix domain-containing protein [Bacteroidota bacterium]